MTLPPFLGVSWAAAAVFEASLRGSARWDWRCRGWWIGPIFIEADVFDAAGWV